MNNKSKKIGSVNMNCIIVDDDELSCKILENFVLKTEGLNLLKIYSSPVDALNNIQEFKNVDLLFLDIEMPQMTGLDFLNLLDSKPQIIIVSAKEKYALDAFDFNVTDYFLKPVSYARFFKGITKVKENLMSIAEKSTADAPKFDTTCIFVRQNYSIVRIEFSEILWIEALENYVNICTNTDKYTVHQTLKNIENMLPSSSFLRIHRSYIVNTSKIARIEDNVLVYKVASGVERITIGKSYRDKLNSFLNVL